MAAKIFRINYKSDFILTLTSDAGWMTPFCIKFWTGSPMLAYYASWDGEAYTHCAPVAGEPTKLLVQFDDHHLPIGDLKFQIAYHFTVADFPNDTEDEVLNQANITTEIDGETYQVMLDFTGETAPEIQFSLPAYANEAQRIANEQQRIANETQRIANEETRIQHEESRIAAEQTRQQNEQQRINQEQARVNEYAGLKADAVAATGAANDAAALANQKAQLAADKAALAGAAATLANAKAQLAADKAALAESAATLANQKAALAQQKAEYAQEQGTYSKNQGDYAKEQGDYSKANGDYAKDQGDYSKSKGDYAKDQGDYSKQQGDYAKDKGDICAADHQTAVADHQTATADHQTAAADHQTATTDHNQAGNDHTRAESDHTRAESDHAAVEVYVDSLGAFDISSYHATGGELAKYADLTAALGTNGANIPDALRKGGMSVKFVLSSDNNSTQYVQYRYTGTSTANADFTNVANWQKSLTEYSLIKIAAWGASGSSETMNVNVGDVVYNSTMRLLRRKISENAFETVSYVDGAIYNYDNDLYIWNGTDLELKSTFKQELEKDSTETTAVIRSYDGKIIVNPAYTNDVVDKYYTYGSGIFAVVCRQIVSTDTASIAVAAYNKNNILLKGYYQTLHSSVASPRNLYNVLVDLPQATYYVKIHGNNNEGGASFCETKLYALTLVDMPARQVLNDSINELNDSINELNEGVNELNDKLIKLAAWTPTGSPIAEELPDSSIIYNSTTRLLRRKLGSLLWETVPYEEGAIYHYDGNLYVWNGTDLSIVSTTPIEIAKDSRETTAILRDDGVVLTSSSYTYDIVDKYYTYGGGVFAVSGRRLDSNQMVMVAAYAKDDTFIQSFYPKGSAKEELTKVPVVLPKNTWYIKVHGNTLFNETKLYSLSQVDMNARDAIEELKGESNNYEPEVCRRRFYKAMEEKCANLMMSGYIIEGPSGYGRYNAPSDEVENPILGHGQAQMPITGMCRLIANSLNYPFLANLWSEKERVIKSENTDFSYVLTRSLDEHYGEQLESEYIILAWKTGTKSSGGAPWYTNLLCAATNYNLNGKVLAGYVHLALDPLLEDEETNRCKAMKILFNIGEALLANRSADISSLQTQLLGQSVAHAEVMVYPSYAAFMSNFNASANSDYRLYHYYNDNSPNVNTFSTIKVLATQIVLDYVDDLDEVITITANDIYWAPYSGAIFSAGQEFTIRNLLYAFLMISSNQAGYALARVVGAKLLDKYGDEGFIPQGS